MSDPARTFTIDSMVRLRFLFGFLFILQSYAYADIPVHQLLASKKSGELGAYVVDLSTGAVVASKAERVPLVPASVQKLAVTGAALRFLGPEYRFSTGIYGKGREGSALRHIYIKGSGDPSLTIESLMLIVRELRVRGIRSIGSLVLDDSLFDSKVGRVGIRAYEAGASALAFNYNSIGVTVCPSRVGSPATIAINPWEAGIEVTGSVRTVKPGRSASFSLDELPIRNAESKQRLSIKGEIPSIAECKTLYRSVEDSVSYLARTFLGLCKEAGIAVPVRFSAGKTPSDAGELYVHKSPALLRILEDLNHFSNNIIAEQLVFALAENRPDGRRYREDGLGRIASYLKGIGISEAEEIIADGSGLSRDNRLSPFAVVTLLKDLWSDPRVRPEFEVTLSRLGESGTLEKRRNGNADIFARAKTGSLTGVSSLAGFLVTQKGRTLAFALLQNGTGDRESAQKFEERILESLYANE